MRLACNYQYAINIVWVWHTFHAHYTVFGRAGYWESGCNPVSVSMWSASLLLSPLSLLNWCSFSHVSGINIREMLSFSLVSIFTTYKTELSKKFIIQCHFSLTLVDFDFYLGLAISCCGEHLKKTNQDTQCTNENMNISSHFQTLKRPSIHVVTPM